MAGAQGDPAAYPPRNVAGAMALNLDKMRHQMRRGAGEALVVNGLTYGRTSSDVMRDYERPLRTEVAKRVAVLGKSLEEAMRAALQWEAFPQRWVTAGDPVLSINLNDATWVETSPGGLTNASPINAEVIRDAESDGAGHP